MASVTLVLLFFVFMFNSRGDLDFRYLFSALLLVFLALLGEVVCAIDERQRYMEERQRSVEDRQRRNRNGE